jgi:hypothetical protein
MIVVTPVVAALAALAAAPGTGSVGVCDAAKEVRERGGRSYEIGADVSCGEQAPRGIWGLELQDVEGRGGRFEHHLLMSGYVLREEKARTWIEKKAIPPWLEQAKKKCRNGGATMSRGELRHLAMSRLPLSLDVQVDASGKVLWARVVPPKEKPGAWDACLERRALGAEHPAGEPTLWRYPLVRAALGGLKTSALSGKKKGKVRIGGGTLPKEAIRQVVRDNSADLRTCYEGRLAHNADLFGKVVARWKVGADGRVTIAEVVDDTVKDKPLADCIVNAILGWQFPKPKGGGIVVVTYPFVFKQGEDADKAK